MKRYLLCLLLLLAASPGWARPRVETANNLSRTQNYAITFTTGDTSDTKEIEVSGFCSVRYTQEGSDTASLYAVTSKEAAASSGTLIGAFTASTTTATTFTAGTRWVKAVATDATAGGSVMTIDCAPLTGGGGVSRDSDGDGLYETAWLWDADGDGSTYVTCTAKDTPDPACKVDGEVIYRDLADDVNCAVHGCGNGQMEIDGSLYLRNGVSYINWPCWDAREPTGFNDPTATNDNLHDSVSDTAWGHCPATPDFADSGRRFINIAFLGWQGELIGGGVDTRNPDTTENYARDRGTYLVDDRGPRWDTGAQQGQNNWFGQSGFIRGITTGFTSSFGAAGTASESGEYSSDGDSSGYGLVSGDQIVDAMNGSICVCEDTSCGASSDNWAQGLVAGDIVEIEGTTQTDTFTSAIVVAAIRVRDVPTGTTCDGAGTTAIPLGGQVTSGTSATAYAVDVPFITQVTDGFSVVHMRSDARDPAVRITNVTVTSQDRWNDASGLGDCSITGEWSNSADGAATDFDCDTEPMFGIFGGGRVILEDFAILNWHAFGIDGNSNIGNPQVRRVRWFYGNGGPIMDPGSGWNMREMEVWDSQFSTDVIANYGPGISFNGLKVYNSTFTQIFNFQDQNTFNSFQDIEVYNSAFTGLFAFGCGARQNSISKVRIAGFAGNAGSQGQGSAVRMTCADNTAPIQLNFISDVNVTGIGPGISGTGGGHALVAFDTTSVIGDENSDAIVRNHFEGFRYKMDEVGAAFEACLFAVRDSEPTTSRATGPDFSLYDVLTYNTFYSNSIVNTGGGSDFVYCGCGVFDASGNNAPNVCDDAIVGSGGGGADPRGCMNVEGLAAPADEACS